MAQLSSLGFCGRSIAGIANSVGKMDLCLLGVEFCQVKVPAMSRSLGQRSPAECGASECDRDASISR
jgi:hypothetical protein